MIGRSFISTKVGLGAQKGLNYRGFMNQGGGGVTVPTILSDGNTVAWYDYTKGITESSNKVSQWDDQSGSGNHLVQATPDNQPTLQADGVLFDGVNDFMNKAFTLIQPTSIYILFKQITWTANDRIFDGFDSNGGSFYQTDSSPYLAIYAGNNLVPKDNNLALDTWGIARVVFSGYNSSLQINENLKNTGNASINSMNGFTLGAYGGGAARLAHVLVKEVYVRKIVDTTNDNEDIYNYLITKL